MTNQSTIDKLIEMRLTTMADAFRNQLDDPKFKEVPFEDRFGMLVDIEYSNRKNNRQKRQGTRYGAFTRIRPAGSKYNGYQLYFRTQAEQRSYKQTCYLRIYI